MTYLREVRLLRIHSELREVDPDTVTVGALASRWGFLHAGRFAAAYKRKFGCSPSTTLRS
jgi:AraC-like DNA-binding protein